MEWPTIGKKRPLPPPQALPVIMVGLIASYFQGFLKPTLVISSPLKKKPAKYRRTRKEGLITFLIIVMKEIANKLMEKRRSKFQSLE